MVVGQNRPALGMWISQRRCRSQVRVLATDDVQKSRSRKCRSCRKGRYAPPVHMIKLTETREITPYKWGHPDETTALKPGAFISRQRLRPSERI